MTRRAAPLEALGGPRHGFLTRAGGVSEGAFASLNCGYGSGDDPTRITRNRAIALDRVGAPDAALCTAFQRHTALCATVTEPWPDGAGPQVDAMVTDRPGIALGVLTADCAPVLFADRARRVIGAAHAGWRGALAGVLEAAVAAMAALGSAPGDIVAAVGPCIGQGSYQVGPEFRDAFAAADPANDRYFTASVRESHHMFDLPGYVADRLAALGLAEVAVAAPDTCADAERFFSYRRACLRGERDYGRLISIIALTV